MRAFCLRTALGDSVFPAPDLRFHISAAIVSI
jgi:hypothetical protein